MLGVDWMELLVLVGTVGAGAAMAAYLALRLFVWGQAESQSLERIRKHALWTGVLAWGFSSLAPANRAGIYFADQVPASAWSVIPWFSIIAPAVAVVAVHAVGQASWPAPKSPQRVAMLAFRRTRDFIEPALGWTVAGIFAFTAAVLITLLFVPGHLPANAHVPHASGPFTIPRAGLVPGYVLATALSIPLLIVASGTVIVMRLTALRRSLEALTPEQNTTLRVIGINRLLRVSATVASGLSALAGNYLTQPGPDSTAMSWVNWLGILNLAVLITMLVWKPPALQPTSPFKAVPGMDGTPTSKETTGTARLLASTATVLIPATAVGMLAGYALRNWLGWMGIVTAALLFMVLAYLALEVALARKYGAGRGGKRTPLSAPLPRYLCAGFGMSVLGLVAAALYARNVSMGGIPRNWDGFPAPAAIYVVPCLLAITTLLLGLLAMWFVLARPAVDNVPAAFDASLRRRSLFRITRTVTSCWFALTGLVLSMSAPAASMNPLEPQFDPTILGSLGLALAAIVLFLPVKSYASEDFTPLPSVPSAAK